MPEQTASYKSLEDWYWQLLECSGKSIREKLLGELRCSKPDMAAELERMLAAGEHVGAFLEPYENRHSHLTERFHATIASQPADECRSFQVPEMIGQYKLLEPIGEGGMGLVYLAQQSQTVRRKVAIKIIKPGMDNRQVIARFEAERQALAMMEHPNIAKVLDAGTSESGLPYFVMELVRGIPITEYCDRAKMPIRQRLELFRDACSAIQHAHNKGIIHRDIKPSNVLVTEHDGTPLAKVIDFGVAKALTDNLTDKSLYTGMFQMLGTPLYMSPEQASLSNLDVDVRSDVYSLGVLLYELVSGTLPINRERAREMSLDQLRRHICDSDPPRPSRRLSTLRNQGDTIAERGGINRQQLVKSLAGELDWIVMKAIEKDRNRRYQSARELAEDVSRHLGGEAVEACPPSLSYRLSKSYRRHRGLFLAAAASGSLLLAGISGTAWQAYRATVAEADAESRLEALQVEQGRTQTALEKAKQAESEQRRLRARAEASEQDAKWRLYVANLYPMRAAWLEADYGKLDALLDATIPAEGQIDYRGWEWFYLKSQVQERFQIAQPAGHQVCGAFAWCETTRHMAALDSRNSKHFYVWDYDQSQILWKGAANSTVRSLEFSPDGTFLALGTNDGNLSLFDQHGTHVATTDPIDFDDDIRWIRSIDWKPDGSKVAFAYYHGPTAIYDLATQKLEILTREKSLCGRLDWHPTENLLAAGMRHGERRLYDLDSGVSQRAEIVSDAVGLGVAWSPSGNLLAVSEGEQIRVLNRDLEMEVNLVGHFDPIQKLLWMDEGHLLSSADDHTLRYWDVASGRELKTISAHSSSVSWLAIDHESQTCFSAGEDGLGIKKTSITWEHTPYRILTAPNGRSFSCRRLVWAPDGAGIAAVGNAGSAFITGTWTASGPEPISWSVSNEPSRGLDWSPDGTRLLRHDDRGVLGIIDPLVGIEIIAPVVLDESEQAVSTGVGKGFLSPSGTRIANINGSGFFLHDTKSLSNLGAYRRPLRNPYKPCVAWSADEKHVLVAGYDKPAIFDLSETIDRRELDVSPCFAGAWHADSRILALGAITGRLYFYDAIQDQVLRERPVHRGAINCIDLSPDGRRLASAGSDGVISISDLATGDELFRLEVPGEANVSCLSWSPDGFQLAAGTSSSILVWSVRPELDLSDSLDYLATGDVVSRLTPLGSNKPLASPISAAPWKRWYSKLGEACPITSAAFSASEGLEILLQSDAAEDCQRLIPALRNFLEDQPSSRRTIELARAMLVSLNSYAETSDRFDVQEAQIEVSRCLTRYLAKRGDFAASRHSHSMSMKLAEELIDRRDVTARQWRLWESVVIDKAWIRLLESRNQMTSQQDTPDLNAVMKELNRMEARLDRFPSWARLVTLPSNVENGTASWKIDSTRELIEHELAAGRMPGEIHLWTARFPATDYYSIYRRALCYAAAGNEQAYRRLCLEMLDRFTDSQDASELSFATWTCSLLPGALEDYQPAMELIDRALASDTADGSSAFYRAAILVRAGRQEEARKYFEGVKVSSDDKSSPTYRWLFEAILELESGDIVTATELYDKARGYMETERESAKAKKSSVSWNRQATQIMLLNQVRRQRDGHSSYRQESASSL